MMPRLDEESRFISSQAEPDSYVHFLRDFKRRKCISDTGCSLVALGCICLFIGAGLVGAKVLLAWVSFVVGAVVCVSGCCMHCCINPGPA